jgi:hypothetical protein
MIFDAHGHAALLRAICLDRADRFDQFLDLRWSHASRIAARAYLDQFEGFDLLAHQNPESLWGSIKAGIEEVDGVAGRESMERLFDLDFVPSQRSGLHENWVAMFDGIASGNAEGLPRSVQPFVRHYIPSTAWELQVDEADSEPLHGWDAEVYSRYRTAMGSELVSPLDNLWPTLCYRSARMAVAGIRLGLSQPEYLAFVDWAIRQGGLGRSAAAIWS